MLAGYFTKSREYFFDDLQTRFHATLKNVSFCYDIFFFATGTALVRHIPLARNVHSFSQTKTLFNQDFWYLDINSIPHSNLCENLAEIYCALRGFTFLLFFIGQTPTHLLAPNVWRNWHNSQIIKSLCIKCYWFFFLIASYFSNYRLIWEKFQQLI